LGARTALSVAFCAGALLALSFVFAGGTGEDEVRRVAAVRHSAAVEAPEIPRTMIASYYDYALEGLKTASGEPFDPEGYTAAHRTLPLGTRLLVSYEGRSVRVTVNDRGPYVKGHDLDLSLAAARKIGLVGPGTAPVLVTTLQAASRPAPSGINGVRKLGYEWRRDDADDRDRAVRRPEHGDF
jgi:rare lipoprotein A